MAYKAPASDSIPFFIDLLLSRIDLLGVGIEFVCVFFLSSCHQKMAETRAVAAILNKQGTQYENCESCCSYLRQARHSIRELLQLERAIMVSAALGFSFRRLPLRHTEVVCLPMSYFKFDVLCFENDLFCNKYLCLFF